MTLFASIPALFQQSPELLRPLTWLDKGLTVVKVIISVCGAVVILSAAMMAFLRYISWRFQAFSPGNLNKIRLDLGMSIILGLEFIVAADVIETTTAPDYYSVGILVIVVGIRTLLSLSLNKEIADAKTQTQS